MKTNNMKALFICIALPLLMLVASADGFAQQDPQFTQYFFNPLSVNSGYAGTREALNVTLLAREQWIGIDGRPRTQSVSVHTPLRNESIAVGLSFMKDQIGPINSTAIFGDFAYRIRVNEKSRLAFGMKAGLNLLSADFTSLRGTSEEDVSFAQNINNTPLPNFGFSVYWWADRFFLGASTPKLLENEVQQSGAEMTQSQEKRHFFIMGGYVFDLKPGLKFKPTFQTKYVTGAPVSMDLTANFLIDEWLWLGGMYRFGDAFALIASFQLTDQLRAGYSYDYTLSELSGYNSGSHELMVSYDFVYNRAKTLSPRYF